MSLVVIGGVAAGLSAAARARRIDPRLEIVVLEQGPVISYGACGLPYFVEGRVRETQDLIAYTPEYFRKERKIDVRTGTRVVSISHPRREVVLESGDADRVREAGDRDGRARGHAGVAGRAGAARIYVAHAGRCGAHASLPAGAPAEARGGDRRRVYRGGSGGCAAAQRPAGDDSGACGTFAARRRALLGGGARAVGPSWRGTADGRECRVDRGGRGGGRAMRHGGDGGGLQAECGTRGGRGGHGGAHGRDRDRRTDGDQRPRHLRGGRLRGSQSPGDWASHVDSAGHDGE